MGRLDDALAEHVHLGLDTAVFIYHLEEHPRYLSLTQPLLSGIENGRWTGTTSTVAVMELTVRPWQLNRPDIARAYEDALTDFPNLTVADVTMDVAHQAARLRAQYRIRPADAIQVATTLVHGATAFVTNDQQLTRLAAELDLIVLDALMAPP
jgi:predicted nucleic acid-binding protein